MNSFSLSVALQFAAQFLDGSREDMVHYGEDGWQVKEEEKLDCNGSVKQSMAMEGSSNN